jgi:hypothetical protein
MGALPCYRGNCPSVMCDRYSEEYGYICNNCFEELVRRGAQTNIAAFMASDPPVDADSKEAAAHSYFDRLFAPQ